MFYRLFVFINILILTLLISGCKKAEKPEYIYPNDPKISDASGVPIDSLTYYFPSVIKTKDTIVTTGISPSQQNWYASDLYAAKEPILFNYYTGNDLYRFTWIRSFHLPVIISIQRDKNKVWMITKELDRHPQFTKITYSHTNLLDVVKHNISTTDIIDSIVGPNRFAEFKINKKKELALKDWYEFESLLDRCKFRKMLPVDSEPGCDGAEWIIEGHLSDRYWFVNRWSPRGNFRACGEYLIKLSGLKEEIY